MSREMWSQVNPFEDGDSLDAKTLNVPIGQLGERTDYLYARINEMAASGSKSSVILTDAMFDGDVEVGNAVYLTAAGRFAPAKASMSLNDDFSAADSAFTVGIVQSRDGDTGSVLVYGSLNLNPDGSPMALSNMIQSGEEFRSGRYYLSCTEAGRLTSDPTGPRIYVCTISATVLGREFDSGRAMVNPQFLDIGTSHVHRTAVLKARPAGALDERGRVIGYHTIDQHGPLTLLFGGSWQSLLDVQYEFWVVDNSTVWPGGFTIQWSENGGPRNAGVAIPAPETEFEISNGLTAKLIVSGSTAALGDDGKHWAPLTFPEAGRGWISHAVSAEGVSGQSVGSGRVVAEVSGAFDASPLTVNVAFPWTVNVLTLSGIVSGSTISRTYTEEQVSRTITYEFTEDVEAYSGENTPVQLGVSVYDSALYLAEAMSNSPAGGSFAAKELDGVTAALVVMGLNESAAPTGTIVTSHAFTQAPLFADSSYFDIYPSTVLDNMLLVVYDGDGRVLSNTPTVAGVSSWTWKDVGSFSVRISTRGGWGRVVANDVIDMQVQDDNPGAIYDYVVGLDRQIADYWPPIPPKAAALTVNGVEMDNKALVPINPTVSFGKDTIHWFEDDAGRKPWPEVLPVTDPADEKVEVMHWVRGFQGSTGPVTSLQAREGSPFKVVGYGTNTPANVGDLEIVGDFDFEVANGGVPGFNAVKVGRAGKLLAGPVVERIVGGAGVNIMSTSGSPQGQGTVIISLDDGTYRSQFNDIALENAEQSKVGMFPYIRMKGYSGTAMSSPSAFTATMRVPTGLPSGNYILRMQATVFGETGFSNAVRKKAACFTLDYGILPDYDVSQGDRYLNLKTGVMKPISSRTVLVRFGHGSSSMSYNEFDPVVVTTENPDIHEESDVLSIALGASIPSPAEFSGDTPWLRPGYLLGVRLSRTVTPSLEDADPYTSAIGFINLSWALSAAE